MRTALEKILYNCTEKIVKTIYHAVSPGFKMFQSKSMASQSKALHWRVNLVDARKERQM